MLAGIQLRREHCVRYRFRYSACERCAQACPHGALAPDEEGVRIDAARCRNCALCASACSTEALVATHLSRNSLVAAAGGRAAFTIACAPSEEAADAVVPCLGALDAVTLAAIGRHGAAVELRGSEHCIRCEHAPAGAAQVELNLEGAARLREAAGEEGWPAAGIVTGPRAPEATPKAGRKTVHSASRRHLFRRFLGCGVDAVAASAEEGIESPVPLKAVRVAAPVAVSRREVLATIWPRESDADSHVASHPALPGSSLRLAGLQ